MLHLLYRQLHLLCPATLSFTDYKYILCGKYFISILRIEAELASVIRILDTRTDYVRTIFGG